MQTFEQIAALKRAVWGIGLAVSSERGVSPPPTGPSGGVIEVESPLGITGDKVTKEEESVCSEVKHIEKLNDWLNLTFPSGERENVEQIITDYLGQPERQEKGTNTYQESKRWITGAIIAWTEGRAECWLSMNGDSCDMILPEHKLELFEQLRKLNGKCTRLDAALDVPRSMVSMEQIHAAAMAQQVVGFKRYDPRRPIRNMDTGQLEGDEANFGRRGKDGSGRYVRVYDKGLESNYSRDCIRFEVETSGEVANLWFSILCDSDDVTEFEKIMGRIVCGSIDFADKVGAHRHRDRFERLSWWASIVELVGQAKLTVQRVKPAIQRTMEWAKSSLPRALATFCGCVKSQGMHPAEVLADFIGLCVRKGEKLLDRASDEVFKQPLDLASLLDLRPDPDPAPF